MSKLNHYKIIFWGTSEFGAIILTHLCAYLKPILVITTLDEKIGRHQILTPSPVKTIALNEKIPVLQPEFLDDNLITQLKNYTPDIFIVASYGKIIPKNILDIPIFGALNIHPSLLPKYRGASPIQTVLMHGEKNTGVTLMLMDAKMDHGPIIAQTSAIEILPHEIFTELHNRLALLGAALLIKTLPDWFDKKITPQLQNDAAATFCYLIKKNDGQIDWSKPADLIYNQWRAFCVWPGIYSSKFLGLKQNSLIKLITIKPSSIVNDQPPGTLFVSNKKLLVMAGGKTALEIIQLQPAGKNVMLAENFINGYLKKI